MSKYLRVFDTVENAVDDENLKSPNVSYCEENEQVVMAMTEIDDTPLYIFLANGRLIERDTMPFFLGTSVLGEDIL